MQSQGMFGGMISLLEDVLNLRSLRHKVIASNIANIDTPHYKAFDVMMEEAIEKPAGKEKGRMITRTQQKHLPMKHDQLGSVTPRVVTTSNTTVGGRRQLC